MQPHVSYNQACNAHFKQWHNHNSQLKKKTRTLQKCWSLSLGHCIFNYLETIYNLIFQQNIHNI